MLGIIMLAPGAAVAADCAACHPKQAAAHARSSHARSLRPILETEFARALPDSPIGEARGGFLLTYTRSGNGIDVLAERGAERARGRIEWAFGAGDQGITPLAQIDGQWLEHRISYYVKPGRFDLTLGHRPGASASAAAALGIAQPDATLQACLGCHATLAGAVVKQAGVECQRCHSNTAPHPPAPLRPTNPVETCAACHRLTPPNGNGNDPLNIRFQPLRLVKSKCYTAGHIDCGSCHAPHENARRADAAYYEARCTACHAKPHRASGCLDCHMPKSSPAPYLTFTDHYIRIKR